jgi:hypothetical protein
MSASCQKQTFRNSFDHLVGNCDTAVEFSRRLNAAQEVVVRDLRLCR